MIIHKSILAIIGFIALSFSNIQAQTISTSYISGSPFCAGQTVGVNFSVSGIFNSGNTFSVELSDATGDFTSPTTIGSLIGSTPNTIFATIPTATIAGTGYKVRVVSNDPVIIGSTSNIVEVQTSLGDPSLFGDGFWYGYTYIDNNWNTYAGYFQTGAGLNIKTTDYYAAHEAPDNYNAFATCGDVPNDNYSVSFKRTNFPCGKYQINIPDYDDKLELYIDGVQILTTSVCCQNLNNVWEGYLGANSKVEVRYAEYYANGFLDFELIKTGDFENTFTLSPAPAICSGGTTTLGVTSSVIAGMSYSWSPVAGLSATTGTSVTATPAATTTYTVTATDPTTGCSESRDVTVTISNTPVINITASSSSVCIGGSTTLTASGANTYTWSPATGLNTTTGNAVIASPTTTTTYTVTGDNSCGTTASETIIVTVGSPITDDSAFGNGKWNVYCYNGNFTTLEGLYTESNLSFQSADRWNAYTTPSNASGYVGCSIGTDNHAVSYKRTNFECGVYQLDVPIHDDQYWLYINGVEVATHDGWGDGHEHLKVWTGILGPTSTVEFRWKEGGGGSNGALTFTKLNLLSTSDISVCANVPVTLEAVNDPDATYTWSPAAGLNTTSGSTVIASVTSAVTYTVTATKDGCTLTNQVNINMSSVVNLAVTPSAPVICGGQSVTLTASGAGTYTWSPATGLNTTTGNEVIASPATTTTYTVTGSDGCTSGSTSVTVTVGGIDPGIFGDNIWHVYCFEGDNFDTYYGMYTEPDLTFDSRNRWNAYGAPSAASGYTGCTISTDRHSISYKRTNFTCGYYQIDLTNHDDDASLWINGAEVFKHEGCCDAHTNVWSGFLGASSTVELRSREFNGGSHGGLQFTNLSSSLNFTSSDVTICETTSTTLTASLASTNVTWSADAAYIDLSATTGNSITATAKAGANGARTVTCTATDFVTGCQVVKIINITVDPVANTQVAASVLEICQGESVTLTASGANTYTWSPSVSLNVTSGSTVTATPTATTTYTVGGSNNCNTKNAQVTIKVNAPTLTGTEFGDGKWNVFCYEGQNFDKLNGHYEETSLSFDTQSKWNAYTSPSNAPGYIGCEISNDQHSYIYKRTNFPCGSYRIDIPDHDDYCELKIDGVTVFSHDGCCDSHIGAWTGLLLPTSKVEFLVKEAVGGSHGSLNFGFSLATATTVVWTGQFNNDWSNSLNWCQNVPDASTNVIIPSAGVANWPAINSNGAVCKNLIIEAGAQFTINGSLEVNGSWTNNGSTLDMSTSTISFKGGADESIGGTNITTFYNLYLEKPSQKIILEGSVEVNNILTLKDTELDLNQNKISIKNASTAAITRIGTGFINSEAAVGTNNSIISWHTGTNTAAYVFPFGVSASSYIPVTFNKKTNADAIISISTRGTAADNLPFVPGVNLTGFSGADANFVIDRWWDISSSVNPLPMPGADVVLSYQGSENTLPNPVANLAIQHYNSIVGDWDSPYENFSPGVQSGVGSVAAMNLTAFSPHVISMTSKPLPVDFLRFDASANTGKVYLNWLIEDNQTTDYFLIERSQDGVSYSTIARVNASGAAYQFIDKKPYEGISYYRINQYDKEGEFEYSPIRSVNNNITNASLLVVPNPANGKNIRLQLKGIPHNEACKVLIYNMQGSIVYRQTVNISSEISQLIQVQPKTTLPYGMYHVEIRTENSVLRANFIINN